MLRSYRPVFDHFLYFSIINQLTGLQQLRRQAVVQLAVEEISQRDMLCLRCMAHRPLSQITVRDHQIHIFR